VNTTPEDWKDAMFRQHASAFVRILAAREASVDLGWLNATFPDRTQRRSVLDLGCGAGRLLAPLAEFGSVVVGLDYSPELLEAAAPKLARLPNVALVRGDMRQLRGLFPPDHFQLVVRAYTSLGYFDRATECAILRDCHAIASADARLVVDTFNAGWFSAHPEMERRSPIDQFELHEHYRWCGATRTVSCRWRYTEGTNVIADIPFELQGYALQELDALLTDAGWQRERLIRDIGCFDAVAADDTLERLVVVARKQASAAT
jgi:SAM-dependent methyltransferase